MPTSIVETVYIFRIIFYPLFVFVLIKCYIRNYPRQTVFSSIIILICFIFMMEISFTISVIIHEPQVLSNLYSVFVREKKMYLVLFD